MPITSGAVNSSIKQFNQRALRSGHLRLEGGAAAILHTRAAYLPDNLAWELFSDEPRRYRLEAKDDSLLYSMGRK